MINYVQGIRKNKAGNAVAIQLSNEIRSHYLENNRENNLNINTLININKANAEDLVFLNGVGPKTAEKIIALRIELGEFKEIDDLLNVPGIGKKTLEKFRSQITI